MFWSKNKKKQVYPCKPQLYYIKVGCKGVFVTRTCFRDELNDVLLCEDYQETIALCNYSLLVSDLIY